MVPDIKKIANFIGINLTKKTFAQGVSKVVPVIGGFISGGINFASMMPMADRLNEALDKATFNYSDEEFNKDIEIIMNPNEYEEIKEEKTNISKKVSDGINNTTAGISKFVSKIGKKHEIDPYEEIKKLKDLLDNDVITQEEFEIKKKQLLDL